MPVTTFDDWIAFVFDHPDTETHWHRAYDVEWPNLDESLLVTYLTRLFEQADTVLQPFSDLQAKHGLHMIVTANSDYTQSLMNEDIPLSDRLRCIRAMGVLFERCFAVRCSLHLSHLDEPNANPLNSVCYMWWDNLPIHGLNYQIPEHSDSLEIDRTCLETMHRILDMDSIACQESVLHGLGLWRSYYPSHVKNLVNDFLRQQKRPRRELVRYAKEMLEGYVM